MRAALLTPEAHPWAKTGGLADVLAALPAALQRAGVDVVVVLPAYREALARAGGTERLARVLAPVSSHMEPVDVLAVPSAPVPTVLLSAPRYFDRDGLYGPPGGAFDDNAERFVVFCRAALEWLRTLATPPDVLHAHDWPAALAPAFLHGTSDLYPELRRMRSVQTVHNLAYQGRFPASDWHLLNLDRRLFTADFLEFYGGMSFLKAGLVFADAITTVSPTYAREIRTPEYGEGLDGVLRARSADVTGILNGIDPAAWDPASDPALPAHFDRAHPGGKATCKAALQAELGLTVDAGPALLGVVSRLAEQKGIDVLTAAVPALLARHDVQLVVLGNGAPYYETALRDLAARFAGRVGVHIGFDEGLAHRIEAGADVFLMPSRYEPCGLNQLYSLRYGTVPVVSATGGLVDTVADYDPTSGEGTGFTFRPCAEGPLLDAVERALSIRRNPAAWARLVAAGMAQDFSWERSARAYRDLYARLLTARR